MTIRMVLGCAALVMGLGAGAARPALAWGGNGHAIVADIAEARLSPAAARQVGDLLALEGHRTMDQIASWPDSIGHIPPERGGAPETLPWHYVDIDVAAPGYAAADCPDGNCVVARLPDLLRVLGDARAPRAKRLAALKWVVHLVGDIHQPLHAAERDHDKGGNMVKVSYFGETRNGHLNLHSLWDEGILEHETGLTTGPHYAIDLARARQEAAILNDAITPGQAAAWAPQGLPGSLGPVVAAWANESHALARDVVYADLPHAGNGPGIAPGIALGAPYDQAAWPVIQVRLEQAGVRLADVLNAALPAAASAPVRAR
ncbi:S1/P1 nuclease [Nguyenibacter sp. L1]|uniref:S1/P1 nuclease n=1 Tax=Nguyenibacter sp. L1 TaxID=3049350 RepID=UPI002B47A783|nr:S1/P1 nuclease [Nguyenibacter sp. L1]WRH87606.1 S1/P1 nuclease [Nguyenibacter sp. L1]